MDNFITTFMLWNVIAEEYSMKSIGKHNCKSMTINNEKLTMGENNFTRIDSLANY